ncbi:MAG: DNA-deoxyinosine glycosylase [Candidatus Methylumidiphilus sp.]
MPRIQSFPPIANPHAKILLLGSMPGAESLRAAQYYAHPRNAFWPIMGELFGAGLDREYQIRLEILKSHGIALWDVLASCVRVGSLDSAIEHDAANDFPAFFQVHPHISRVYFNGAMAEKSFHKHVRGLPNPQALQFQRLPSTSPAHAALRYKQKLEAWRVVAE